MEGLREIGTIWQGELRRAVRSPRTLVLVLLYVFFSAAVLVALSFLVSSAAGAASAQGLAEENQATAALQAKALLLRGLFGDDPGLIESLAKIPILIPLLFKITLFFLPAYSALMGFDQLSSEIESRSIRYLAVRARRSSILFGKFTAQATILVTLILVVDALVFAYARIANPEFDLTLLAPALLRFWLAAFVFSLAYVALTSLCSSLFSLPAVSLIFNLMALFAFWIIEVIGRWIAGFNASAGEPEPFISKIRWISPSAYSDALLHPAAGTFFLAVLAFAVFAAVFLAAGYGVLRRRDV